MLPRLLLPPAVLAMLVRPPDPPELLARLAMVLMAELPAGLLAMLARVLVLMPLPARMPLRPLLPPARLVIDEGTAGLGLAWRSLRESALKMGY